MNTLAVLSGVTGLIAYFFFYVVGVSKKGNDGQGVNEPISNKITNPQPSASEQRGRWE